MKANEDQSMWCEEDGCNSVGEGIICPFCLRCPEHCGLELATHDADYVAQIQAGVVA